MNIETNLIITCYSGPRRQFYNNSVSNLLLQNYALNTYKHNTSVTYVCTCDGDEFETGFMEALEEIRQTAQYPFEILFRENIGASYGSFSHAYEKNRNNFKYFIFLEDDYIPCYDNFDTFLSSYFKDKKVGYVCTYADKQGADHAAISIGMLSGEVLSQIYNKKQSLAYASTNDYRGVDGHEYAGQVQFSLDVLHCGYSIVDTLDYADAWFLGSQNDDKTIVKFLSPILGSNPLFIPAQCFLDILINPLHLQERMKNNDDLIYHYGYPLKCTGLDSLMYLRQYMMADVKTIIAMRESEKNYDLI